MTKKADHEPKKKKKARTIEAGPVQVKIKAPKGGKKKKKGEADDHGAFDALAKLADHPLIAELIAVGATAAVAAIAEKGLSSKTVAGAQGGGKTAVKAAGKAAAAAIGRRLVSEFNAVKEAGEKKA